ncbi:MAG: hypothetical protein EZS28_009794, partial [Streblomastix strix]
MTELQSESIPLLVNSIISDDPLLRAHSTERLVSIALLEEQSGSASGELYLCALITLLKIDENAPQHVHTNTLSIIIELLSNGVNLNELAGLIPILTKLGSEKDEKKKKITTKAKMIETQLASLGIICPPTSDEILELKRQNEEYKRITEEQQRIIQDKERININQLRENEQLKSERNNLVPEMIKYSIPLSVLKKIGDDFKIPLGGTEDEKRNILEVQECDAQLIINTYENKEDNIGRRRIIQAGVVESLLHIFENRELSTITRIISLAFFVMTTSANDEIKLLLFQKNPYPGLLRLLDHTDILVAGDAIAAINNILIGGSNTSPITQTHPHFESMNEIGGIEKIYALFRRNVNQHTKYSVAFCIGYLFRAKEIEDADMRREIVAHLKLLTNDPDDYIQTNSKFALIDLARNE